MAESETVKLWYEEAGKGIPFIFLHGYPLNHTIWHPAAEALKNEVRVILPDLRGFGKSPVVTTPYSLSDMADDVIRLMDAVAIEKAVLIGHSMGGYISFAFAKSHSDRLLGLGLVATHHLEDTTESRLNRSRQAERVRQTGSVQSVADEMPSRVTSQPEVQDEVKRIIATAQPAGVAGALEAMLIREDASEILTSLTIPAVVIAGKNDKMIPLERAQLMSGLLKNGLLFVIDGAEHMPMLEATGDLVRCLLALKAKVIQSI